MKNQPCNLFVAVTSALRYSAVILLAASCGFSQDGRYRELRIPSGLGFVFPAPEKVLTEIRSQQDKRDMRSHAWALFSGLVQPAIVGDVDGEAVFETWYSKREMDAGCQRLVYSRLRELRRPIEIVANFMSKENPLDRAFDFFSDVHSPRGEVLYNFPACSHIKTLNFLDAAALDRENERLNDVSAPAQERDVPQFPPNAAVVKDVWTVVPPGVSYLALPGATPGDLARTAVMPADGKDCNLPLKPGESVLTSCFFNIPVTDKNIDSIRQQEENGMPPVCRGCVLILVALHVITKEMPDWTWSTFWWSPEPDKAPYGSDRPGPVFIPSPWRNYVMNTTLSMVTPWGDVTGASETSGSTESTNNKNDPPPACTIEARAQNDAPRAKICFNPYIERMLNNSTSNCMNCHKQASYPRPSPDPTSAARRGYLGSDAACFSNRVRVDYLWSLSPTTGSALFEFAEKLSGKLVLESQKKNKPTTH